MKHVKSFSNAQLWEVFQKIRHAVENLQTQSLRKAIKRGGDNLEQSDAKKVKPNEATESSIPPASSTAGGPTNVSPFLDTPPVSPTGSPAHSPEVVIVSPPHPSTAVPSTDVPAGSTRPSGPRTRSQTAAPTGDHDATRGTSSAAAPGYKTYGKRRKSLAVTRKSSQLDLHAPAKSFIHELSDDSDGDENQYHDSNNLLFWHAFTGWEVLPTGLGDINALSFLQITPRSISHI